LIGGFSSKESGVRSQEKSSLPEAFGCCAVIALKIVQKEKDIVGKYCSTGWFALVTSYRIDRL
jgi:hypothetical protein